MEFLKSLEGIRTSFGEAVMGFITHGGEELLVMAIICILFWSVNKKLAYRICFAYFASGLMVQALKITFRIPRPWIKDTSFKPVGSALETATGYSFPSGHTQTATALYLTLALNTRKKILKVIFALLIIGVGFSRMYLGVHTPADVITSFAITVILAVIVNLLMDKLDFENNKHCIAVMVTMILIAAGVAIYSFTMFYSGKIEEKYVSDCCKAASAGLTFAIGWFIEQRYIKFDEKAVKLPLQVLKCIIGFGVAIGIKTGLKPILGTSIPADAFRYMLLIMWVLIIFPLIIKRFFSGVKKSNI